MFFNFVINKNFKFKNYVTLVPTRGTLILYPVGYRLRILPTIQ